MTYINEVVKLIESEFAEKNAAADFNAPAALNASAALTSIAARAAEYPSVLRRNQLSKVCMHAGAVLSGAQSPVRKESYIIC